MGAALFGYINAVDTAAISAGSEANSMRSYNLSDPILMQRWRSLVTTSYALFVFQQETEIAFLALAGATLGPGDSIRHRLYDASNIVVLDVTVDAGVVPLYGVHFYRLDAPLAAVRWRCDIVATSRAAQGYFDVGRAWAGPSFEPKIGVSEGFQNGWLDSTDTGRAKYSGVSFNGAGAQRRAFVFSLDYLDEEDRAVIEDMAATVGVRNQVFFVPFIDSNWARQAILGRWVNQDLIAESNGTSPPTYSQPFRIEQDL